MLRTIYFTIISCLIIISFAKYVKLGALVLCESLGWEDLPDNDDKKEPIRAGQIRVPAENTLGV